MASTTFGTGIYTAPDAARMIGMGAQTLRRWLTGYRHDQKNEDPLWRPLYDVEQEGKVLLGFRDLVEARIINALRGKRIGLPTIRLCLERARNIVGDARPFSTSQFKTDGKSIFLQITQGLEEPELIDLKRKQGVFNRVVAPSLSGLDFGADGAERWWLLPGRKTVVADPRFAFGQPIIADFGITTERLYQAVQAEGSEQEVARLFEIPPRFVRDAVRYERFLHERAA